MDSCEPCLIFNHNYIATFQAGFGPMLLFLSDFVHSFPDWLHGFCERTLAGMLQSGRVWPHVVTMGTNMIDKRFGCTAKDRAA